VISFDIKSLPLCILEELEQMAKPHDSNATFRFVGGCVRDTILGRKPKDFDIVTNTTADTLEKMGLENVGKFFPVYLHNTNYGHIEVAVARSEEKVGAGHKGFVTTPTGNYEDDRVRRDLTMNAMMVDAAGTLYGWEVGYEAIAAKTMEQVSNKFAEDPLRVLRVARFAAQLGADWTVSPRLVKTMWQMQPELATLPPDRVREELKKVFASMAPHRFFEVLKASDCLSPWFPGLTQNFHVVTSMISYGATNNWTFEQFMIGIGAVTDPDFLIHLGVGKAERKAVHYLQIYKEKMKKARQCDSFTLVQIVKCSCGILSLEQLLDCVLMDNYADSKDYILKCQDAIKAVDMNGVTGVDDAMARMDMAVTKVSK